MIAVARAAIKFRDRDLNEATVTLHFPSSVEPQTAINAAIGWANIMLGISNAIVVGVKVTYREILSDERPDGDEGRAQEKALIFLANEDEEFFTIAIPCAKYDIWKESGPYVGNIYDESLPSMSGIADVINDIVGQMVDSDGNALDYQFETIARAE